MKGVPPRGLPNINSVVGRSIWPVFCAPAAWSMREDDEVELFRGGFQAVDRHIDWIRTFDRAQAISGVYDWEHGKLSDEQYSDKGAGH